MVKLDNSIARSLVSGWRASFIASYRSGLPLSVFLANNGGAYGGGASPGSGPDFGLFSVYSSALPLAQVETGKFSGVSDANGYGVNGNPASGGSGLNLFSNPQTVAKSFRDVLISQDGRHGRGVLRGLSASRLDLSLVRDVPLREHFRLALSANVFNAFNTVLFADPTMYFSLLNGAPDPDFGVLNKQLNQPRRIQFGARLEF